MTQDTQDLEAFMHRLLRSGVAPHDASREGLNYAISMIPPAMSAKDSLDTASRLLEQATKNIGIGAQQLNDMMTMKNDSRMSSQPLA